jgi:DNA-binding CsgD family transcriptional regulator
MTSETQLAACFGAGSPAAPTRLLASLLEGLREAGLLLDLDRDRILTCNGATATVFGGTPQALADRPAQLLWPDAAGYADFRARVVPPSGSGPPRRQRMRLQRIGGARFVAETVVTPPTVQAGRHVAILLVRDLEAGAGGAYRRLLERLTPREREVFGHAARGLSSKEIARRLALSPRTVEVHRARVLQKLELRTTTQLLSELALAGPALANAEARADPV